MRRVEQLHNQRDRGRGRQDQLSRGGRLGEAHIPTRQHRPQPRLRGGGQPRPPGPLRRSTRGGRAGRRQLVGGGAVAAWPVGGVMIVGGHGGPPLPRYRSPAGGSGTHQPGEDLVLVADVSGQLSPPEPGSGRYYTPVGYREPQGAGWSPVVRVLVDADVAPAGGGERLAV